jgi:hypothetical protein
VTGQLGLFDAPKVASVRKTDPRTAKVAAALDPEGRASQADRILEHLFRHGSITADQALRTLTLPDEEITRGEWSTRIGVLMDRGLVERAGEVEEEGRRGRVRRVLSYRLSGAGEAWCWRRFR